MSNNNNSSDIIKSYIRYRFNNQVTELLNLLSTDCILTTLDKTIISGNTQLQNYYSQPQSSIPSVSNVNIEGNKYYVDLSYVLGLKTIRCYFTINSSNKISAISINDVGWF